MKNLNKEQVVELVNSLVNNSSVFAIKVAKVGVTVAEEGQVIDTILVNGVEETSYTCKGGEFIIQNPDGEKYHNTPEAFAERYMYNEGDDFAIAKANVRKLVDVPASELPITFPAPWGGEMTLEDGYLNYDDMNGIYCIGREEFNNTHKITDEKGVIL